MMAITALLDRHGIERRMIEHGPTRTCEESAAARGEALSVGGKSIVLKVGETFRLCVLSASRQLNSNAVRRHFKQRKARFASADELLERTGLVPGSVPPFGSPILDLPVCLDTTSVVETFLPMNRIAFNAGSLEHSIVMAFSDYERLVDAQRFSFSR